MEASGINEEAIISGAIFCQVASNIHKGHLKIDITLGNQKWKGAAPILINNLTININIGIEKLILDSVP